MTGSELRQWRQRMRFTQQRAAQELGCSRATYNRWEAMDEVPRMTSMAAMGVSMVHLNQQQDDVQNTMREVMRYAS